MGQTLDQRNANVLNWVNGEFFRRYDPAIPIFDSGFMHGKQVWSAPRLVKGRLFRHQDHLDKIRLSAEINFWPVIPTDKEILQAVRETLETNEMHDGVHVRIMLTAGNQSTASMDISTVVDADGNPSTPRIIVAPEYRKAVYDSQNGIKAITCTLLRPGPEMVDQRSHDNNQNASARACLEAKRAGATTGLMYDLSGCLAEAFASHAAIVKDGKLLMPKVRCCPEGVTRKVILELCAANGLEAVEADIPKAEVEDADELIVMGTMSGPVSVTELDGRPVGDGKIGPITRQLYDWYSAALLDERQSFAIFA